jgi:hypothetical protein
MLHRKAVWLIGCGCLLAAPSVYAVTTTWNGGTGLWTDSNWSNGVPTTGVDVVISTGSVTSSVGRYIGGADGATLTIGGSGSNPVLAISEGAWNGLTFYGGTSTLYDGTITIGDGLAASTGPPAKPEGRFPQLTVHYHATFNQAGGLVTGGGTLTKLSYLIFYGDSTGASYNLSGGTVNAGQLAVNSGKGTFTQTGGTANIDSLETTNASSPGGYDGTYRLQGGLLVAGTIKGSALCTNHFEFSGGTLRVGTYTMYNGSTAQYVTRDLTQDGAGSLLDVTLQNTTLNGNYLLGAGTANVGSGRTLTVNGAVGNLAGAGVLNVNGGTLIASGTVDVDTLNFTGGTLTAPSITAGALTQDGAGSVLDVTNKNVTVTGDYSLGTGTANVGTGRTLAIGGNLVNLAGTGAINVAGGTLTAGVMNIDAASLSAGSLTAASITGTSSSTFSFTGGTLKVGSFDAVFNGLTQNGSSTLLSVVDQDTTIYRNPAVTAHAYTLLAGSAMVDNGRTLAISGANYVGISVSGSGTLNIANGTVRTTAAVGQLTLGAGGKVNQTAGLLSTYYLINAGTYELSGGTVNINTLACNGGTGVFTQSGGQANIVGQLQITNPGGSGAGKNGTYNLRGGTLATPLITGHVDAVNAFNFTGGTLRVTTVGAVPGGLTQNNTHGASLLDVSDRNTTINGVYQLLGGTARLANSHTLTATGGTTIGSGGALTGSGTVIGSVASDGLLSPGDSIGLLAIQGDYHQNADGTYLAEINADDLTADRVVVTGGSFYAGGTLDVELLPGTSSPGLGDVFDLIDGSIVGTFSELILPALSPGLSWSTADLYTMGQIEVVVPEPLTAWLLGSGLAILGLARLAACRRRAKTRA